MRQLSSLKSILLITSLVMTASVVSSCGGGSDSSTNGAVSVTPPPPPPQNRITIEDTFTTRNMFQYDISDDSRYVVFNATTSNGNAVIGLFDKSSGDTQVLTTGSVANPNISADGRYVSFVSDEVRLTNFGCQNGTAHRSEVYLYDAVLREYKCVSGPLPLVPGDFNTRRNDFQSSTMSKDGSVIILESGSGDYGTYRIETTSNNANKIYLDVINQAVGSGDQYSTSLDGNITSFFDTTFRNGVTERKLYVHDDLEGSIKSIDLTSTLRSSQFEDNLSVSADGTKVLAYSNAAAVILDLLPNGTNEVAFDDINSIFDNGADISPKGRFIAFITSEKLLSSDGNIYRDVYIFDNQNKTYQQVSNNDVQVNLSNLRFSSDGKYLSYMSGNGGVGDDNRVTVYTAEVNLNE